MELNGERLGERRGESNRVETHDPGDDGKVASNDIT